MYSEDAKTILDMIHMDTEKMIAEITQKYGDDIDTFDPIKKAKFPLLPKSNSAIDLKPSKGRSCEKPATTTTTARIEAKEHGFLSADEDGQFSSDSLEDCSLDLDVQQCRPKKTTCHKHGRGTTASGFSTLPTRSVSDYFIYDQPNIHRNVSLSDILNDDTAGAAAQKEHFFLTSQRHSSASFFLGPNGDKKSQESLLSDDISGGGGVGGGSYFNSMESILSDDSECKSAPLEALFLRSAVHSQQPLRQRHAGNLIDSTCATSKSYGSSPNALVSSTGGGFDYFMQHSTGSGNNNSYYDYLLDANAVDASVIVTASSSTAHQQTYPWITQTITKASDEFIPRLNASKNVVVSKSLSKEFADQRYTNNTNPMMDTKSSKPAVPAKPAQLKRVDIFGGGGGNAAPNEVYVMKKSMSYDVDMFDGVGRRLQRSTKKYEQNLEKFEKERKRHSSGGGGQFVVPLEMDYVPHKPPVANRRSTSMKNKRHSRDKDRYHTVGQIHCSGSGGDDEDDHHHRKQSDEKSFEIYIAEKGATENNEQEAKRDVEDDGDNSLEFYSKPKELSEKADSLEKAAVKTSIVSADFLTAAEYLKFRDIEKKIDVINKLVELEERKLEQERVQKEQRLRPFRCDSKQKGYVKSLTMNFDKLAKCSARMSEDDEWTTVDGRCLGRRMKRNFSLPDVLEGAKFQAFEFLAADDGGRARDDDIGLDNNLCNSTKPIDKCLIIFGFTSFHILLRPIHQT